VAVLALPEDITTRVLSPYDILEEHDRRKERYISRDELYGRLIKYYHELGGSEGIPILPMNAQGRPLLRPIGERPLGENAYSAQRLPPIVDDYASLMGRMPTSRVEPPDPSIQGEQRAELLTKFLYSTYELSNLDYQQALTGHYLSLLGDSVYVLEPESDLLRVVWNVVSPQQCWPSFYHGYRRFDVYDLIIGEVWTVEDLVRQLGVRPDNDQEENRTVVTYISPYQRTQVVGLKEARRVAHVEWDLDFCPVVWVFNKVTGYMCSSDIIFSLGQQDYLDFLYRVWADGIVHMTYPIIGVRDPINIGQDQIVVGPGSTVGLQGPNADIIVRNTQGDPRALVEAINHTLEDINTTTGTSGVRQQGQMKSSITTGRAVQSVQGPQSTRIEFKQQVLGNAIESANRMTLMMQERAPLLKGFKGPIYGNYKGQSFMEEFDASKDIDGWYRNKVAWQSLVGMNLQQKTAVAYEGMVAKLWDDVEAREMVGVEDPTGMRKRIESQMLAEAALQQKMQQPQPEQPAPQGQQPAPLMFRPPQLAQQEQGGQAPQPGGGQPPVPQQPDLKSVLQKLASQLRGSVWVGPDGTVYISDSRDYSRVLQVVRQADPQVKVRATPEDKMPEGSQRLI
jgi:hypothetical protein